jgi:hypothetical protein
MRHVLFFILGGGVCVVVNVNNRINNIADKDKKNNDKILKSIPIHLTIV